MLSRPHSFSMPVRSSQPTMILVTGAAGKTGKAIIRLLSNKGECVKALVFHPEQIQEIEILGAREVVAGDMRDSSCVRNALHGVASVYHICPNVHLDEIAMGQVIIEASESVGIAQFVYHSVLHPQIESMPHHWKKMRVEERLLESGLPYTILQPAVYMQNISTNWQNILEKRTYSIPYAIESRISMVDLEDVALAAVNVLTEVSPMGNKMLHLGATYELVGTPAMSPKEISAIISRHLGFPVIAESLPRDAWERQARKSGLGDYQIKTLSKMFEYYEDHGFWGNSQVLNLLIHRPPTNLDAYISRLTEDHYQ